MISKGMCAVVCFLSFISYAVGGSQPPRLSAGTFYCAAVDDEGTVWSWGDNLYGQLGIGVGRRTNAPTRVRGCANVVQAECGDCHTLALDADGRVWAWGRNNYGQLGNGSLSDTNKPCRLDTISNIVDLAAGVYHGLAVDSNGIVYGWGRNDSMQIGGEADATSPLPVPVKAVSDIFAVAAGVSHSVALDRDGRVWTWGGNAHGQLGRGDYDDVTGAGMVEGVSNIVEIASGDFHSLALDSKGVLWSWGMNRDGQLGRLTAGDSSGTAAPVDHIGPVISVCANSFMSMAITRDGRLWAWGDNQSAQLGNGDIANTYIPTRMSGLSNTVTAAAGYKHSVALRGDGTLRACGRNDHGQLGDGTFELRSSPAEVLMEGIWKQEIYPVSSMRGVSNGFAGLQYVFSAEGASSSWGRPLEYMFDWGDGTTSSWSFAVSATNTWSSPGVHGVRVRTRSLVEPWNVSEWSRMVNVDVAFPHTVIAPKLLCEKDCVWAGSTSVFEIVGVTTCSWGHAMEFLLDFGDGSTSQWFETTGIAHEWKTSGLYGVTARARCSMATNVVTEWSEPYDVSIVDPDSYVPVHVFHSIGTMDSTYDRLWTADMLEAEELSQQPGWRYEGVAWYAYTNAAPGTVPVRRFRSKISGTHLSSADPIECGVLTVDPEWIDEGIQFHVYDSSAVDRVPVYRFNHPYLNVHYFTCDSAEMQGLISNTDLGYVYEGIVFYVLPAPGTRSEDSVGAAEDTGADQPGEEAAGEETETEDEIPGGFMARDFGWTGCVAVPGDYDNDGMAELAVYDPYSGEWSIVNEDDSRVDWSGFVSGQAVPADYDGDGVVDMAVYCYESGTWHIQGSVSGYTELEFGWDETTPVPRDYDGDGSTDLGVYYPGEGRWYIWTSGGSYYELQLGDTWSTPMPGDYDGDGMTDLAVYEPSSSYWHIWTWNSDSYDVQFGVPETDPIPADYDGDGATDLGAYEPELGRWYIWTMAGDYYDLQFGWPNAVPIPADYNGDGRTDLAVFDPEENRWYVWTW